MFSNYQTTNRIVKFYGIDFSLVNSINYVYALGHEHSGTACFYNCFFGEKRLYNYSGNFYLYNCYYEADWIRRPDEVYAYNTIFYNFDLNTLKVNSNNINGLIFENTKDINDKGVYGGIYAWSNKVQINSMNYTIINI